MVNTFTPINLLSYNEINELILRDNIEFDFREYYHIIQFIEENTKKIPDRIVDELIEFAESYS